MTNVWHLRPNSELAGVFRQVRYVALQTYRTVQSSPCCKGVLPECALLTWFFSAFSFDLWTDMHTHIT